MGFALDKLFGFDVVYDLEDVEINTISTII